MTLSKTVHYIGPYSDPLHADRNLLVQPSGIAKMNYILSSLQNSGFRVCLFSTAPTKNNFFCHYAKDVYNPAENTTIIYPGIFGGPTVLFKVLSRLWSLVRMLVYLLKIRADEDVLIYHVYYYRFVISLVRIIKKNRLVFEVEEVYNVLWRRSKTRQEKEMRYLRTASAYILVNDLIAGRAGLTGKPGIVCYGDYRPMPSCPKESDGLIHLVFSGLIETGNGGVNYSLEAVRRLPEGKYQLHITGYGDQESIDQVKSRIKEINKELDREAIVYHGCLNYDDHLRLISTFHIGLATTDFNWQESMYMFPSKILVYIRANLSVVASPMACIESSRLNRVVALSRDKGPGAIADAIMSVGDRATDCSGILKELDSDFKRDLKALFLPDR